MFTLSSDILSLTGEAAVLLQGRRLVFANAAARAVLGADCVGKSVRELFGDEVAEAQTAGFLACVPVAGRNRLLRVSREGSMQVIFLSTPDDDAALLSDAYLQALRSGLMNLSLSLSAGQRRAEELNDPALERSLAGMAREYYRLNRLLANISAARGISAGELPVTLGSVDLRAMVGAIVESVSLLRPDVALQFSSPQPALLWADQQLLELMLLNLLSNSLLHAEGLTRIRIDLDAQKDRLYLTVRDDGRGIPPEKLCTLFCRYRSAFDLQELPLGAGLGMTVVRGVAEAHGGTVMLESREGAGTMVRVSLLRSLRGESFLREGSVAYAGRAEPLLTGLATCLPDECFLPRCRD